MMRLSFQIREAVLNLRISKLRSFLAVLGILVGTSSVVAMISGGQLAAREVLLQFKSLGTNLLAVQLYDNTQSSGNAGNAQHITYAQATEVKNASSDILAVAPYTDVFMQISFQGNTLQGNVVGATNAFSDITNLHIELGRYVNYLDQYQHFAVIGHSLAESLKQYTVQDPIGLQIKLGNQLFTVIGVTQAWPDNPFIFNDLNYTVSIPIQTASTLSKNAEINNLIIRLKNNADINTAETAITAYFKNIAPSKQIYFRSAEELVSKMKNQQNILTIFLAFIGGISLFVGGIGVMNIMLVSVTERKREIGIRLAIGAKRRDIQSLFLIEGIFLSLCGGVLGVLIGVFISFLIALIKHWDFTLFLLPPLIGFSVSVIVGIFFGFYPAYKASKLNPIDSLHAE